MIRVECQKLWLNRGSLFLTFCFYGFILFCASLAIGPDEKLLRLCAPALLWILGILTTFFSIPILLKSEANTGHLDEVYLHAAHPGFYLLSKVGAEWLLFGISLSAIGFLVSPFFGLSLHEAFMIFLTLLVGFPALSALGILGGLLTLQARGGALLLSFLILPLTLPLLLFSLSTLEMLRLGLDSLSPFCLLIGASLFLVVVSIGTGIGAFKQAVEG